MNRSKIYIILLMGTFLWCTLIVLPSLLSLFVTSDSIISNHVYKFFSRICHQYDSRSLHLFGQKLTVCARCTGIYFGFLGAVILFGFFSLKKILRTTTVFLIAIVPMLLDIFLDLVKIHSSNLTTRFATGLIFGIMAAQILIPIITEAVSEILINHKTKQGVNYECQT